MFETPFHKVMKEAREKRSLSHLDAAKHCRMTRSRWTQIERNHRPPSLEEKKRISLFLKLGSLPATPFALLLRLKQTGQKFREAVKPFYPPCDRESYVRYRAALARHRSLVEELSEAIRERPDYLDVLFFTSKLALGSYLEAVNLLLLLEAGALPALVAPLQLGQTPHVIVDPATRRMVGHRPSPCLCHAGKVYYFQVSFDVRQIHTVDVLCWDGESWSVIEIDGEGHNSSEDAQREEAIGLPTFRYRPCDLVSRRWAA